MILFGACVLAVVRSSFSYIVHPTHSHPHTSTHIHTHPHTSTQTTSTRTHTAVGHMSIDLKKQACCAHSGFASHLERGFSPHRPTRTLVKKHIFQWNQITRQYVDSAGKAPCHSRRLERLNVPTTASCIQGWRRLVRRTMCLCVCVGRRWVCGVKTEHLTGRSTHAYFSRCVPCGTVVTVVSHRVIQCTCIGSRLDESSEHMCRVLKTARLLQSHSSNSCLVAISWACLIVILLFLLDWRPNRRSAATSPAPESGLAEWLNSSHSQVMSPIL